MIELWMQTPHGIVSKPFELPNGFGIRSIRVHDMLYAIANEHKVDHLWVRRKDSWRDEDFNWLKWRSTGLFNIKHLKVPDQFRLAILLKE